MPSRLQWLCGERLRVFGTCCVPSAVVPVLKVMMERLVPSAGVAAAALVLVLEVEALPVTRAVAQTHVVSPRMRRPLALGLRFWVYAHEISPRRPAAGPALGVHVCGRRCDEHGMSSLREDIFGCVGACLIVDELAHTA